MFYLLVLILFLTIFMLLQRKKGMNKSLTLLVLSYFIALSSMILYISKDTYYYNLIKAYFDLPDFIWKWLFFVNIDKSNIIRIMNASSLSIVMISTYFTFSFFSSSYVKIQRLFKIILWIYCLFQLLIYDPLIHMKTYYYLYPDHVSVLEFQHFEQVIYQFTHTVNVIIVLLNLIFLLYALYTAPKLKLFQYNYLFLAISYATLSFLYAYFISATPDFYMKISKIAGTYSFRSIRLENNTFVYRFLPYVLIPAIGVITYCAYMLTKLTKEANLKELFISKEISSSETTSKIFCHYIKNEVLAIQSEVEILPKNDENGDVIDDILKRCNILYDRIDEIHRSTKTSALRLQLFDLETLIMQTLDLFSFDLEGIQLELDVPKVPVTALVDPAYMEQALHNIIKNSIDAMHENSPGEKKLTIHLYTVNNWIQLDITDNGKGISKENLDKIFLPFYSSHSYSRHWGVGLTHTYKVVSAHEGKIIVNSTPGAGTTVGLLLPNVDDKLGNERTKK